MTATRPPRGLALMIVLWSLTALAIILSEFMYAQRATLNALRNQRHAAVGRSLAMAAIRAGIEEVSHPYRLVTVSTTGEAAFHRQSGEEKEEETNDRSGTIAGVGRYLFRIEDEDGRMNVNDASRDQLSRLLGEAGMAMGTERDTVVDSVLDWIDANDLHRANGAEDEHYRGLASPYLTKNAPLDTVEELLLVRGITPELFAGAPPARPSLRSLLTVHRSGALNRNTAPRPVLAAELSADEAATILARRDEQPYEGESGRSYSFTITGEGQAEGAARPVRIRVVAERSRPADTQGTVVITRWLGEDWTATTEGRDASR